MQVSGHTVGCVRGSHGSGVVRESVAKLAVASLLHSNTKNPVLEDHTYEKIILPLPDVGASILSDRAAYTVPTVLRRYDHLDGPMDWPCYKASRAFCVSRDGRRDALGTCKM